MQTQQELEEFYGKYDPWGYENNPDDIYRANTIWSFLDPYYYRRALDIGCGHGFITKLIRANSVFGIELSDNAAKYLPDTITRIHEPVGKYDLIMATGILYQQYDHEKFYKWIMEHSTKHILIAGIKDWLLPYDFDAKVINRAEFKYREFTQQVTLYSKE
jgi:SAM-dependent methyltransferase